MNKGFFEPAVTILISAYNEEEYIHKTIENKLQLDYPKDKLEIIVVSDGSTDSTDDLIRSYESKGVQLIRQEPRAGKTAALNIAVPLARGEIIVFSDANSLYAPEAVRMLVRNFADPTVGYVTGKMIYINDDGTTTGEGCSTYMKYENFLRSYETRIGSVVGVDGGIDACRKSLYQAMNPDQLPDFILPLRIVEKGCRVVYEPEAILKEPALEVSQDEYKMRVRVSLRSFWAMSDMRHLLSFRRFKAYAWQLWSHKVLRYISFIFMIAAYLLNLALLPDGDIYRVLFLLQTAAWLGGIISPLLERKGYKFQLLYFLNYFLLVNLASCHALIKFLLRQQQAMWTPRKGN